MYRILIVANETAEARELEQEVARIAAGHGGEVAVRVCCPAHPPDHPMTRAWTQEGAIEAARERLAATLGTLRAMGIEAEGEIGDNDPVAAMGDALRLWPADMLLISTHPERRSRWLRRGVVERAARFGLPVRHVVSHVPERVGA
ncbi:MAG: hypothetical protein MUE51_05520 [Thermoleophilia bacterium]|nr:hypothetical protein [Thermoleophilia bacterium]